MFVFCSQPSRTSNEFVFSVDERVTDPYEVIKIHHYEMVLSVPTIQAFRMAAVAVATAAQMAQRLRSTTSAAEAAFSYLQQQQQQPQPQPQQPRPGLGGGGQRSGPSTPKRLPSEGSYSMNSEEKQKQQRAAWRSSISQVSNALEAFGGQPSNGSSSSNNSPKRPGAGTGAPNGTNSAADEVALKAVRFAEAVKRALKPVGWSEIVFLLTQLEQVCFSLCYFVLQ